MTEKFQSIEADPSNPFVIIHDNFITAIAQSVLLAQNIAVYNDLSDKEKMMAMISGTLTGLIAICKSKIEPGQSEKMMALIRASIEPAGINADSLVKCWRRDVSALKSKPDMRH